MDLRSGFNPSDSTFYSKRSPITLPTNPILDITTFISSREHAGNIALIDASSGRRISYTELFRSVSSVASYLSTKLNVRKGDVILILSPNSIYFPIVSLAVMSLGAILTTTNPLNTAQEISKQVTDSQPKLVFTTRSLINKLSYNFPIVMLEETRMVNDDIRIVSTMADMIKTEPDVTRVKEKVYQTDTATLLYSSGTTGNSKGVMSTHRNLIFMVQSMITRLKLQGGRSDLETFICTIPMFHAFGLASFAGSLGSGSTAVVLSKFEMGEMLRAVREYKATYLPLVPTILVAMVNESKALSLGSLRWVICGGAPVSKEVIKGFREKYPAVVVLPGYGLTEGFVSSTDSVEESERYGMASMLSSSGMLLPNMQAKIVNPESGVVLPPKCTGELWIRGPSVMKGYFKNLEATKSTVNSKGWLRTGDLCYFDEDGYLFVVDRLKELIKYKDYQVPPSELEALLLTHPKIIDAAVIPFPDKNVGQLPMAYIVMKVGSNLSENIVMEFIAKQVAPYKRIRRVAFVSEIPKNQAGKILRKDLIKLATSISKI